jgi:hypothetical protein
MTWLISLANVDGATRLMYCDMLAESLHYFLAERVEFDLWQL